MRHQLVIRLAYYPWDNSICPWSPFFHLPAINLQRFDKSCPSTLISGFRTTKSSRLLGTRFEEQRLTLRIHRGRSVQNHHHPHSHSNCPSSPKPISSSSNNGRLHGSTSSGDSSRVPRSRSQDHLAPSPRGNHNF